MLSTVVQNSKHASSKTEFLTNLENLIRDISRLRKWGQQRKVMLLYALNPDNVQVPKNEQNKFSSSCKNLIQGPATFP